MTRAGWPERLTVLGCASLAPFRLRRSPKKNDHDPRQSVAAQPNAAPVRSTISSSAAASPARRGRRRQGRSSSERTPPPHHLWKVAAAGGWPVQLASPTTGSFRRSGRRRQVDRLQQDRGGNELTISTRFPRPAARGQSDQHPERLGNERALFADRNGWRSSTSRRPRRKPTSPSST